MLDNADSKDLIGLEQQQSLPVRVMISIWIRWQGQGRGLAELVILAGTSWSYHDSIAEAICADEPK